MYYAIINADNDTVARYETMEQATEELAYFTEDYCVVDYYAFFHNIPAVRIQNRIQYARDKSSGDWSERTLAWDAATSLEQFGITFEQVFG